MPPKKHIIIIGVLCVIALGLGYWVGLPKEGSGGGGGNGDPKEPEFLKQGLVAYYPFNGNANDESVNSNHGTVSGATLTTDRNGSAGRAYHFDGVNDWVDVTNNSMPVTGAAHKTMSFWMKMPCGFSNMPWPQELRYLPLRSKTTTGGSCLWKT